MVSDREQVSGFPVQSKRSNSDSEAHGSGSRGLGHSEDSHTSRNGDAIVFRGSNKGIMDMYRELEHMRKVLGNEPVLLHRRVFEPREYKAGETLTLKVSYTLTSYDSLDDLEIDSNV